MISNICVYLRCWGKNGCTEKSFFNIQLLATFFFLNVLSCGTQYNCYSRQPTMSLIFTFSQYCHSFTCFRDKRGGVLYWSALFVFSCSILTLAKTNITKHHMHVFIKCSIETLNCGLNNKLIVFYICNSAVSHHRPEPPTKQVLKIIHVTSGLNLGFPYYESSSLLYQGNIAIVTILQT